MEPTPPVQPRKHLKEGVLILLVTLLAFSIFTPRSVEYSDIRFIRLLPGIINIIVVPVLIVTALALYKGVFKLYFILFGFLAVCAATLASAEIKYEAEASALKANGVWGKAIVTDKKTIVLTTEVRYQIKCSFVANNNRFETRYVRDNKNTYKKGDTLDIHYDNDFPKLYYLKMVY